MDVVLRCHEVLMPVFEYQQGFPRDVVEVSRASRFAESALELFTQDLRRLLLYPTEQAAFFGHITRLQECVAAWLAGRGVAGVPKLLRLRPSMAIVLCMYAVTTNDMGLLRSMDIVKDDSSGQLITALAAWHGHVDALGYLSEIVSIASLPQGVVDIAAARGHLDTVRFLCSYQAPLWRPVNIAAAWGHLHVVQFLLRNKIGRLAKTTMDSAVEGGHLEIVEYLHRHKLEACSTKALVAAVAKGHESVVHYVVNENMVEINKKAIDIARFNGDHEMVEFLVNASRKR